MTIADGIIEDSDDEALGQSLYTLVQSGKPNLSDVQSQTAFSPHNEPQTESQGDFNGSQPVIALASDPFSPEIPAPADDFPVESDAMDIDTEFAGTRRFRTRTAIQLHPYMYDQALYGQYFGRQKARVPESSQDEEFELPDSSPTASQAQFEYVLPPTTDPEPDPLDLRRIMVVDSSDESDSESEEEELPAPNISKPARIRDGLPASVVDFSKDGPESQIMELLSESLDREEDSDDSAGDLTGQTQMLDSDEDIPETAGDLDYMMAPRSARRAGEPKGASTTNKRRPAVQSRHQTTTSRSGQKPVKIGSKSVSRGKRSKAISLDNVLKSLGKSALPAVKLAARTAKKRGSGIVRPVNKYFVVEDGTRNYATPVLNRWRKQSRTRSRNLSSAISRAKPARSYSAMDHVGQTTTIVQALKKPRKQKTYKYHPGDGVFHTTIVELPTNKFVPRHLPARRSASAPEEPSPIDAHVDIQNIEAEGTTAGRDNMANMPFDFGIRPLVKRKLSLGTFVGSNLMEMFSEFVEWNGISGQSLGARLVESGRAETEDTLNRVRLIVSGKVGEIDSSTFLLIYNWLLQSAADLLSPSAIVRESVRSLIYQSIGPILQALKTTTLPYLARAQMAFIIYSLISLKQAVRFDPYTFGQVQRQVTLLAHDLLADLMPAIVADFSNLSVIKQGSQTLDADAVALEAIIVAWSCDCLQSRKTAINVSWAFIFIQTASKCWADYSKKEIALKPLEWPEVEEVIAQSLKRGGSSAKQAMERCILLITRWQWPANAGIINTFFEYFAKQQNYADPEGEMVNLPVFLSLGRFDGTVMHLSEHHTFLELLGLTLRQFAKQNDLKQCRRIVGRVSPLSTLTFPEDERVSAADLSRASQQFGILLVCMRFCPLEVRPLVAQIADLLQLEKMHLALVLKAVSAWHILASILKSREDLIDCKKWLESIFQSCYSRYLRFQAENIQTAAIKLLDKIFLDICERLIKLNDRSQFFPQLMLLLQCEVSEKTRRKLWQLANWLTGDLSLLHAFYHTRSLSKQRFEIQALGTILAVRKTPVNELQRLKNPAWDLQLLTSVFEASPCPEMYASLAVEMLPNVLTSFVWTDHSKFLRSLSKLVPSLPPLPEVVDISARVSLVEIILESSLIEDKLGFATLIMNSLRAQYEQAMRSNDLDYGSRQFVLQLRRSIVWRFSELEGSAKWFQGERGDISAETTRRAIFAAISNKSSKGSLLRFETFLAYKLASSLSKDRGTSFTREITTALSVSGQSSWDAALFVMETAFTRYGQLCRSCTNQPISYAFLIALEIAEAFILTQSEPVTLPTELIKSLCSFLEVLTMSVVIFNAAQQQIFRAGLLFALAVARNLSLVDDSSPRTANQIEAQTALDELGTHFVKLYPLLLIAPRDEPQETRYHSGDEEDMAVMEALQDVVVDKRGEADAELVQEEMELLEADIAAVCNKTDRFSSLNQPIKELSLADGYSAVFTT